MDYFAVSVSRCHVLKVQLQSKTNSAFHSQKNANILALSKLTAMVVLSISFNIHCFLGNLSCLER